MRFYTTPGITHFLCLGVNNGTWQLSAQSHDYFETKLVFFWEFCRCICTKKRQCGRLAALMTPTAPSGCELSLCLEIIEWLRRKRRNNYPQYSNYYPSHQMRPHFIHYSFKHVLNLARHLFVMMLYKTGLLLNSYFNTYRLFLLCIIHLMYLFTHHILSNPLL